MPESVATAETHEHKKHRRPGYRKLRTVLLILGLLALLTGMALSAAGWSLRDRTLTNLGLIYVCASGLLSVAFGILAALRRPRHASSAPTAAQSSEPATGFAMVMTLILMALMIGPACHALAYARVALAHARLIQTRTALRVEASDALWSELKRMATRSAAGGRTAEGASAALNANPAGIETRLTTRKLVANEIPAALQAAGTSATQGVCYVVGARAMTAGQSFEIQSYVARDRNGAVRILAWLEQ